MRSYSGLLVFENVFDSIDTSDTISNNLARQIFSPNVPVVDLDCGTGLGQTVNLTYESEGYVEVATGVPLSRTRIDTLLSQGIYDVQVRNLSTCISKGGVCQTCYKASNPHLTVPALNSIVQVPASFVMGAETTIVMAGSTTTSLTIDPGTYDLALIFQNGTLQTSTQANIINGSLVLTSAPVSSTNYMIRYVVYSRTPFMYWLAKTYAGSMLGMKPLPSPMLPLKPSLISSIVPAPALEDMIKSVHGNSLIPEDSVRYADSISDPLEKALYSLALGVIFSSAS